MRVRANKRQVAALRAGALRAGLRGKVRVMVCISAVRTKPRTGVLLTKHRAGTGTLRATAVLLALTMPLLASCQVEDAEPGLAKGVASVHIAEQSVWEWSPDADCSPCHATEAETTASGLCAAAQEEGNPCLLCHTDTTALSQTHAVPFDIRGTTRLHNTEVDNDSCTQCHDASRLTAASADGAMLADSNGKSVDPHALPDTESHSSLACSACHKPHSDTPTAETALETCLSCHHQNVFECNTCHE